MGMRGGRVGDVRCGRAVERAPRRHCPRRQWTRTGARSGVSALAVVAGWGLLSARPADAAFPGADGVIVVSSTKIPAGHCPAHARGAQLVALQRGLASTLLTCVPGDAVHPFVSPDGTEVVFVVESRRSPSQLFTVPLPTSTAGRRMASPVPASASAALSDDDPSWSPAGDGTIVFQRWAPGAHVQLYIENVADPAGAHPVFAAPTGFDDTQAVFDPADPNVLAFTRPIGGHSHILTYDMATHVVTDLSAVDGGRWRGDDVSPAFSPDGTRLVFASDRTCHAMQLFTMPAHGGTATPVLAPAHRHGRRHVSTCDATGTDPVYAPEGGAVSYDSAASGCPRVSVVPVGTDGVATGSPHTIGTGEEPDWAPRPAGDPPPEAPEASLPITLPALGAAMAGSGLWVRHRRARRTARSTSGRGAPRAA